jgi:hypothetical protein
MFNFKFGKKIEDVQIELKPLEKNDYDQIMKDVQERALSEVANTKAREMLNDFVFTKEEQKQTDFANQEMMAFKEKEDITPDKERRKAIELKEKYPLAKLDLYNRPFYISVAISDVLEKMTEIIVENIKNNK